MLTERGKLQVEASQAMLELNWVLGTFYSLGSFKYKSSTKNMKGSKKPSFLISLR